MRLRESSSFLKISVETVNSPREDKGWKKAVRKPLGFVVERATEKIPSVHWNCKPSIKSHHQWSFCYRERIEKTNKKSRYHRRQNRPQMGWNEKTRCQIARLCFLVNWRQSEHSCSNPANRQSYLDNHHRQLLCSPALFHPKQHCWEFQIFQWLGRSLNQLPKSMVVEHLFDCLFLSQEIFRERRLGGIKVVQAHRNSLTCIFQNSGVWKLKIKIRSIRKRGGKRILGLKITYQQTITYRSYRRGVYKNTLRMTICLQIFQNGKSFLHLENSVDF